MSFKYIVQVSIAIFFFQIQNTICSAQDQRVADSLVKIYLEDKLKGSEKLELLRNLSFNEANNLDLSLKYANELISLSKLEDDFLYLYRGYRLRGDANRQLGNLEIAIEDYFKSLEAAIKSKYIAGEGSAYSTIADTYSEIGNSKNAEIYYSKAVQLLRKTNDSISLATTLLNAGDEYFNNKKFNLALQNYEESGFIFKNKNYLVGIAYNKGNMGMVYAKQGRDVLAKENIIEAINILEKLEDYYAISEYLIYMTDIYAKQNDWSSAFNYAQRSLELAQKNGLKKQISESNLKLSDLYMQTGNIEDSYKYYRNYITYRDSVTNIESVKQMANLRTDFEVKQKQVQVDLLNQQKRNQNIIVIATVIALILITILAIGLYRRNRFIYNTNQIIESEKNRSENLLLNILPVETAKELKQYGKVKAKKFESVTVMFTDFKEFTHFAENLSPEKLVESVDFYYSKFDEIMAKYGLEKIKTVGDAYMCAGGLPFPTDDHAIKIIKAAFEIITFVNDVKKIKHASQTRFDIRVGINTGPVVAGVVGTKKFAYDIWGDAVNIASRMESNSEAGKINISENTYLQVKDSIKCVYRGEIKAKNRGMMKMYFANE